ncbi:MAG: transposase [Bacteroidales bacterium]|nr:transposase [Bacteroidales bacterium]
MTTDKRDLQSSIPQIEDFVLPYFDINDVGNLHRSTNLPHWHQDYKYVFITFRLADSIPQCKLASLKEEKEVWMKKHPQPLDEKAREEYFELFINTVDKWLDNNYGDCILEIPDNRKIVEDALLFFDQVRYNLKAYVVMPNHVHILLQLYNGFNLDKVMYSLKSFTAKKINERMNRKGRVWQSEYFDRIIRSEDHYKKVLKYIISNDNNIAWIKDDAIPYVCEANPQMIVDEGGFQCHPIREDADCSGSGPTASQEELTASPKELTASPQLEDSKPDTWSFTFLHYPIREDADCSGSGPTASQEELTASPQLEEPRFVTWTVTFHYHPIREDADCSGSGPTASSQLDKYSQIINAYLTKFVKNIY